MEKRIIIRCPECKNNPQRLFDVVMLSDENLAIEIKCSKEGVVACIDLTGVIKELQTMPYVLKTLKTA